MVYIIAIILFNIILYFPTLFYSYVMDDTNNIEKLKNQKGYNNWRNRLYGAGTLGYNTIVDHGLTMAMWIFFNVLVYYAFGHNMISFWAAMLCSCHPINNQLSIWLNGRRYLICAIFLMISMIIFPWGGIFYLASSLFQVTIIFAPVLFTYKYPWILGAMVVMLALTAKAIRDKYVTRIDAIPCRDLKEWLPGRPVVIVKVFGFYIWKMIFPQRVEMVYAFLQMFGRTREGCDDAYAMWGTPYSDRKGPNIDFIKGVAAFLLCGCIVYFSPAYLRPWAAFMILSLLQWCAIVPVLQLVADRYASIPAVFMCFFISYFAYQTPCPFLIIGFFMGQYIVIVRQVFPMYKDMLEWYEYHIIHDPGNLAVTNLKLGLLLAEKRFFQTQALIEKALWRWPRDYAVNFMGYISAMIVGNVSIAKHHIDVCRKNIYLGEEAIREGELADAELVFKAMEGNLKQMPGTGKKG